MNKKILVITHAGGSPYHGPNMRWYFLGQALNELGIQVEIVSSSSFHKYIRPPELSDKLESHEIDQLIYHWIKTRSYTKRGWRQVINQLEFVSRCFSVKENLITRKPDLIIASSPHPFVNYPAHEIACRCSVPFITDIRDLWPESLMELTGYKRWHPYIYAVTKAVQYGTQKSNKVISSIRGAGKYLNQRHGLPNEKFLHIPNSIFPAEQTRKPEAPSNIVSTCEKYKFVIGYIGAISGYYRLNELITLADKYKYRKDVGFVIVGHGDLSEYLKALALKKEIENIHFVGSVSRYEIPAVLDLFDACYVGLEDLRVHEYGISCNKIFEYMYAAKPILGSYRAGHDPVAEAGCGVVATPGNHQPLIDAIDAMINDETLKRTYGERARSYFDANHDSRVAARKLVDCVFGDDHGRDAK